MKRALRWLLDLLERKFPDKLFVTEAVFERVRVDAQQSYALCLNIGPRLQDLETRVGHLDKVVDKFVLEQMRLTTDLLARVEKLEREIPAKLGVLEADVAKMNVAMGFAAFRTSVGPLER